MPAISVVERDRKGSREKGLGSVTTDDAWKQTGLNTEAASHATVTLKSVEVQATLTSRPNAFKHG